MSHAAKSAIVGLGITEMGKVYGRSATNLALEAIDLALKDAGLKKTDLDGLLINAGVTDSIGLALQNAGGFQNLRVMNHMNAHTNIVGIPDPEMAVGMRVRVTFEDLSDEVTVPKFEPAG